jgi:hypothetical protein
MAPDPPMTSMAPATSRPIRLVPVTGSVLVATCDVATGCTTMPTDAGGWSDAETVSAGDSEGATLAGGVTVWPDAGGLPDGTTTPGCHVQPGHVGHAGCADTVANPLGQVVAGGTNGVAPVDAGASDGTHQHTGTISGVGVGSAARATPPPMATIAAPATR